MVAPKNEEVTDQYNIITSKLFVLHRYHHRQWLEIRKFFTTAEVLFKEMECLARRVIRRTRENFNQLWGDFQKIPRPRLCLEAKASLWHVAQAVNYFSRCHVQCRRFPSPNDAMQSKSILWNVQSRQAELLDSSSSALRFDYRTLEETWCRCPVSCTTSIIASDLKSGSSSQRNGRSVI